MYEALSNQCMRPDYYSGPGLFSRITNLPKFSKTKAKGGDADVPPPAETSLNDRNVEVGAQRGALHTHLPLICTSNACVCVCVCACV